MDKLIFRTFIENSSKPSAKSIICLLKRNFVRDDHNPSMHPIGSLSANILLNPIQYPIAEISTLGNRFQL